MKSNKYRLIIIIILVCVPNTYIKMVTWWKNQANKSKGWGSFSSNTYNTAIESNTVKGQFQCNYCHFEMSIKMDSRINFETTNINTVNGEQQEYSSTPTHRTVW